MLDHVSETSNAEEELLEHLREIRRIQALEKELKAAKDKHQAAAVELLGPTSLVFQDPLDGSTQIANVRAAETLVVDAGQLLEALIEQYHGDVETAETVWKDVLKPAQVDTKDDGLFHQAVLAQKITAETVAEVAVFKTAKAFVGFSKPGG